MAGPMNPYDAPEVQPRGLSNTSKVLLAFGIGCGVLALLCCGVLGVGTFVAYRFAKSTIIVEPQRIREIAREIVTIEIPAGLEPKMGIDVRIPFVETPVMKGAAFIDEADRSFLMLGEANPEVGGNNQNIEFQLDQAMQEQRSQRRRDFDVLESESFETTINDEAATFKVSRVANEESKKEYWRAEGDFLGNGGPAILILEVDSTDFSKDEVLDILKSMK